MYSYLCRICLFHEVKQIDLYYLYILKLLMNKQLTIRSIENEKFGITKGYIPDWRNDKEETRQHYYAKCGYSSNEYGFVYNHVNKCLICKRLLGISKSQVQRKSEILLYFLLDKQIEKYAKDGYGGFNTANGYRIIENESSIFSDEFKNLSSYNSTIALKKGNIVYRNYEYTEMVRNMMGQSDNSFSTWNYINTAKSLGLFDLKICNIPLDTITRIVHDADHNATIEDIQIIESNQDQYYYSVGFDDIHINKKENNEHLEDKFFKVIIRNSLTNEIETRSFIWQWDETAKCLIEVSSDCKNYQEGILFLYPKEIKNRQGTLRQGEFFFEPSKIKAKPLKQFESEKIILNKKHEKSNHFGTHRIVIFGDPYQYISGTVRHSNRDHRMLKLNEKVWYRVHESNKINAWSIDLRRGGSFD